MSLPTTGTGRSVWSVQFYKENDGIDFASGAAIDDLPTGDCTFEFYARIPPSIPDNTMLFSKATGASGWFFYTVAGDVIALFIHATNNFVVSASGYCDDQEHHFSVDWDFGTLTGRLFVDGTLQDTDAAVGAYTSDAVRNCLVNARLAIGTGDGAFSIGPIRLSDSRRYVGASFDPPRRINWPANDANAQLITRMNDGAGATVTDYSGNGNDGTITFGASTRWYNDPV